MEAISTRTETKAVAVTPDDPRCVAIINRYGTVASLFASASTGKPKVDTPSLILCMKSFGEDEIRQHLITRVRVAVLRMDDEALDDDDVTIVANSILNDPDARTLGYDLVLGFFNALERGDYELYNLKPRHIMNAWKKYKGHALAVQVKLKEDAERKQHDAEWEAHKAQCITLAEFKRRQNKPYS